MDVVNEIVDDMLCKVESEFKKCPKCEIFKLKSEFYKERGKKDGLSYKCKGCVAKHYQDNKEAIAKRNASYYQENKEAIAERVASHYQENKEAIAEQSARYYQENKEAIAKWKAIWRQDNKEAIAEQCARYYQENKEAIAKQRAKYMKNRRQTDEGFRIEGNLRCRLNEATKGIKKKSASTMKLIGLESGTQMKEYLALLNPELKGVKCDIDHRLPCSIYDLTLPEHQKACFHYTNLQWLIPEVNQFKKGAKYPPDLNSELDERNKFKKEAPTLQKQLALISHIESHNLSFKQVVELQRAGNLYEVIGCDI